MKFAAVALISPLFAQDGGGGAGPMQMALPLVMIGLLFFFMIIRPQQREQRQRDDMLKQLKKNDRVWTSGGVFGIVTNVKPETGEATIRIDEKNDTTMRVRLSAISQVLAEGDAAETKTESK